MLSNFIFKFVFCQCYFFYLYFISIFHLDIKEETFTSIQHWWNKIKVPGKGTFSILSAFGNPMLIMGLFVCALVPSVNYVRGKDFCGRHLLLD